jgi:hypothetical protein
MIVTRSAVRSNVVKNPAAFCAKPPSEPPSSLGGASESCLAAGYPKKEQYAKVGILWATVKY